MGIIKGLNWRNIFIFLFFIVFPFGQITRLSFNLFGTSIPLLPIDVIVGCSAIYTLINKTRKPKIFGYIVTFLWFLIFSFILSIFVFKTVFLVYGLFYLLRLAVYFLFLVYIWDFVRQNLKNKELLQDSLLGISVMSAVFGWIQFFMIPDIKALFVYGWDMGCSS